MRAITDRPYDMHTAKYGSQKDDKQKKQGHSFDVLPLLLFGAGGIRPWGCVFFTSLLRVDNLLFIRILWFALSATRFAECLFVPCFSRVFRFTACPCAPFSRVFRFATCPCVPFFTGFPFYGMPLCPVFYGFSVLWVSPARFFRTGDFGFWFFVSFRAKISRICSLQAGRRASSKFWEYTW